MCVCMYVCASPFVLLFSTFADVRGRIGRAGVRCCVCREPVAGLNQFYTLSIDILVSLVCLVICLFLYLIVSVSLRHTQIGKYDIRTICVCVCTNTNTLKCLHLYLYLYLCLCLCLCLVAVKHSGHFSGTLLFWSLSSPAIKSQFVKCFEFSKPSLQLPSISPSRFTSSYLRIRGWLPLVCSCKIFCVHFYSCCCTAAEFCVGKLTGSHSSVLVTVIVLQFLIFRLHIFSSFLRINLKISCIRRNHFIQRLHFTVILLCHRGNCSSFLKLFYI